MERARMGIETKKGRNAKGQIGKLKIYGDVDFRKNYLTIDGLNEKNSKNFDPETQTFQLIVSSFDKNEVATGKLLLKMGLEAILTSRLSVIINTIVKSDRNSASFLSQK